jgi:hypothetical protein
MRRRGPADERFFGGLDWFRPTFENSDELKCISKAGCGLKEPHENFRRDKKTFHQQVRGHAFPPPWTC